MRLLRARVSGFKSISELTIDFNKINGSFTHILLGRNETGKSNILEALSLEINEQHKDKIVFSNIRNRVTEPEIVSVFYDMELENPVKYREAIQKVVDISPDVLEKIEVISATREVYIQEGEEHLGHEWQIKHKLFSTKTLLFRQLDESQSDGNSPAVVIRAIQEVDRESREEYEELSFEKLEEIIGNAAEAYFENGKTSVSIWKSSDAYLIQDGISLKAFAEKPHDFPPLRNMFSISGLSDKDVITKKVKGITGNTTARRGLSKKLSKDTTDYLNEKWPELHVKVDVEITEAMVINVNVQDEDNDGQYYAMSERSEGFKQFTSLLLSLAVDHSIGGMRHNLILIDEPEVHLHPSGVRYMLRELLSIGEDNYVLAATHSNFMVDSNAKDRHFITTKKKGQSAIKRIDSDKAINDDEILQTAFGINVIRDFLSQNKLLVEGACDKTLLQKAFAQIDNKASAVIANGHGDNLKAVASICGFQDIHPIVVVDDDKPGQKYKKDIIALGGEFTESSVFTIRDLCGDILAGGTIEDSLDTDYTGSKLNSVLKEKGVVEISLADNKPFCEQMTIHINKEIPTATKAEKNSVAEEVKARIANDFDPKSIDTKFPKLYKLANSILELFG
jgi:predicted ATP-dependent endonuclease of OLD family